MPADHPPAPRQRLIVALAFRIVGALVGIPALLAAIWLGIGGAELAHGPGADKSGWLAIGTYGLVGLLGNAVHGAADVVGFLLGLAGWVLVLLAIAAFINAVLGLMLYLIGRGLRRGALWARILGGFTCAVLALSGLVAVSVLPRDWAIGDAGMIAAMAYGLWVLGWRFGPPRQPRIDT